MTKVKVLKLKSGLTLICLVELPDFDELLLHEDEDIPESLDNYILIIKFPLEIHKSFNPKTEKFDIALCDWIPETEDEIIVLPKDAILTMVCPKESLRNHYYEIMENVYGINLENTEADIDELEIDDNMKLLMEHDFDDEDQH